MSNRESSPLKSFLISKGITESESESLSMQLLDACPWLGGDVDVSEEIGIDLLSDAVGSTVLARIGGDSLIEWHNARTRERQGLRPEAITVAYDGLRALVQSFGKEDAFGGGEYWVVYESLSSGNASIVKFDGKPIRDELASALKDWLESQETMVSVTVIDEDGNVLYSCEH